MNAVSGVITIGDAGNELPISLPFGVAIVPPAAAIPLGSVSTIVIGPPLASAP